MIVSLTSWEANSAWARTESESLHSLGDEEQNEGLRFCPLKSQQQHLAVAFTTARVGVERWRG